MKRHGRPPINGNSKNYICKVRLNKDELGLLEKVSTEIGETKSEVLRRGIEIQNNMLEIL